MYSFLVKTKTVSLVNILITQNSSPFVYSPSPKRPPHFHVQKLRLLILSLQNGGIFPESQAFDIGVTFFNHGQSGEWLPPGERKEIAFLSSQIV